MTSRVLIRRDAVVLGSLPDALAVGQVVEVSVWGAPPVLARVERVDEWVEFAWPPEEPQTLPSLPEERR